MNCANCHINLDWALANRAFFEVDGRQEGLDPIHTHVSSSGEMEVERQNHRGRIFFMIVLILMLLMLIFGLRTDWVCLPAALLLFGAWFWFTESCERNRAKEVETIWSELARQTGLTYVPSKPSFLSFTSPRLFGEYRGRYVSMTLEVEGGSGEYDVPTVFTKITLQVINRAHLSLDIRERCSLLRRAGKNDIRSGNHEFDRRFQVRGRPSEFVQRTIDLPDLQNILLSDESQSRIMKTAYALSWVSYSRPTIELKDWDLVCRVQGVPTLVYAQTAMLNMLCDLAELAEQMDSDSADSARRT